MRNADEDDARILNLDELPQERPGSARTLYDRIIDFLGATKPLNLIAGMCAVIAVVAYVAELLGWKG